MFFLLICLSVITFVVTVQSLFKYRLPEKIAKQPYILVTLCLYLVFFVIFYLYLNEMNWKGGLRDLLINMIANIVFLLMTIIVIDAIIDSRQQDLLKATKDLVKKEVNDWSQSIVGLTAGVFGKTVLDYPHQTFEEALENYKILIIDTKKDLNSDLEKLTYDDLLSLNKTLKMLNSNLLNIFTICGESVDPSIKEKLILINRNLKQLINTGEIFEFVKSKYVDTPIENEMLNKARKDFLPHYSESFKDLFTKLGVFYDYLFK